MLISSGVVSALSDAGLYNASTYISALSGSSWMLSFLVQNNASIPDLLSKWNFQDWLLTPGPIYNTLQYYNVFLNQVEVKRRYLNVSLTDIWGNLLSYSTQINFDYSYRYSGNIQNLEFSFSSVHSSPLPIIEVNNFVPGNYTRVMLSVGLN